VKTSKALQIVKKQYLAHDVTEHAGKSHYICLAAEAARDDGRITGSAYYRITSKVSSLLGGCSSLGQWLKVRHGVDEVLWFHVDYQDYVEKIQATRHAWVDSLILEFAVNGD
jgi:hypothetical protein